MGIVNGATTPVARSGLALGIMLVAALWSFASQAAQLPCGHPDSPPTAAVTVRIEGWKEPLLVEEFKKFGRLHEYAYLDGPYYVPVVGKPEQPKIFKYWQFQKSFESTKDVIALDLTNSPGDGAYTLQIRNCTSSQTWEPIWKELLGVVDTKVGAERIN